MRRLYENSKLIQFICSIRFTIFLLLTLAVILAVATVIESREGTAMVQVKVYRAAWFNFFLAAFTINMLGGTYKRFRPLYVFTGFGVTHVGVFIILIGAFLTRNFCIEGQMTIPTGATRAHYVGNDDYVTAVVKDSDEKLAVTVPIDRGSKQRDLWSTGRLKESGITVVLDTYYPDLAFKRRLEPGGDIENPAIKFRLSAMGSEADGWLMPRVSSQSRINMGPMQVRIEEVDADTLPAMDDLETGPNVIVFTAPGTDESHEIEAVDGKKASFELGGKNFDVEIRQTFGNFTIHGEDFHNQAGPPDNPAVVFTVTSGDVSAPDVAFSKHPDFSLQHGKKDRGYRARYHFRGGNQAAGSELVVHMLRNKKLAFSTRLQGKVGNTGPLEVGKAVDVMAGRITFTVEEVFDRIGYKFEAVNESDEARNPSIHVKLIPDSGEGAAIWLPWGETREVEVAGKKIALVYQGERYDLPFSLKLTKFNEDKYPGSQMSATYQSLVFLTDQETGRAEEILIHMNEPLIYRGYTFFQSSFIPGATYTTVLSVSKDPGKWPTYIGYMLMSIGLILMFYLKSWLAKFDQRRLKKERGK